MAGTRLTLDEVADRLGVTEPTIRRYRYRHPDFPRIDTSGTVSETMLARWIKARPGAGTGPKPRALHACDGCGTPTARRVKDNDGALLCKPCWKAGDPLAETVGPPL